MPFFFCTHWTCDAISEHIPSTSFCSTEKLVDNVGLFTGSCLIICLSLLFHRFFLRVNIQEVLMTKTTRTGRSVENQKEAFSICCSYKFKGVPRSPHESSGFSASCFFTYEILETIYQKSSPLKCKIVRDVWCVMFECTRWFRQKC